MKIKEFKAWFEGYSENIPDSPNAEQWERIKDVVSNLEEFVTQNQVAIRAGYSENTASEIGYENLTKPQIQQRIQSLLQERSAKTEITAENVLNDILATRDEYDRIGNLSNDMYCNMLHIIRKKVNLEHGSN